MNLYVHSHSNFNTCKARSFGSGKEVGRAGWTVCHWVTAPACQMWSGSAISQLRISSRPSITGQWPPAALGPAKFHVTDGYEIASSPCVSKQTSITLSFPVLKNNPCYETANEDIRNILHQKSFSAAQRQDWDCHNWQISRHWHATTRSNGLLINRTYIFK